MEFRGRDYDRRRPRSWDLSGESSSLHRTRSTGQSLAPNVHIYNYTRNDAPSPPPAPYRERLRRDDTRRHDFLSPGWENQRRQRSGSTGDPYFPSFERQQSYESFEEYQSHSEQLSNVRDVLQRCETLLAEVAAISQSKSKHEAPSSSTTVQIFDPSKSKALTFGMLAKTADDHIYRMRAWALEVQLDKSQSLAVDASDTASLVVENLRELEDLAYELRALCRRATPGDLIVEESDMSSTDVDDSSDSEYTSTRDQGPRKFVEPIGVQIRDLLSAAESITQNLSVLSAPMKDGIEPNPARTELRNIVRETEQYFGSERILRQYSVDRRLFGAEALRAARIAAEREKIKDLEALRKKEEALRRKEEEWKEEELRRERDRLREKGRPTLQLPTYVKVHKDHLDVETLMYYQMPYERDRRDPDYYIIMQEMTAEETSILFEHTRRLRERERVRGGLEYRSRQPLAEYTFVRKKGSRRDEPREHRFEREPQSERPHLFREI